MEIIYTGYLGPVVMVQEVEATFNCSMLPQYLELDGYYGTVVSLDTIEYFQQLN
jgi:hypothetical protein